MAKKKTAPMKDLVPVFSPTLVSILSKREKEKGIPLTKEEVIDIRDNSTLIMLDAAAAKEMAASRGYDDLDPEQVWEQWQKIRNKMIK